VPVPPSDGLPSLEDVLSKSQRNDLFASIAKSGTPVTEFDLRVSRVQAKDEEKGIAVVIDHRYSKSYFGIFPHSAGTFEIFGRLDDGEKLATDLQRSARFFSALRTSMTAKRSWPQVPPLAGKWARKLIEVREEHANAPDLWAELEQSKRLLTAPGENTPFTESEQAEISGQIQRVKAYINDTFELTDERLSEVEKRLDEAEQAGRRMGRKDWLMLFNGAVFSLILSDLIPPQAAQHILLMTLHGLGHLFGIGAPPLHLPHSG
jgi:hypothetical protein